MKRSQTDFVISTSVTIQEKKSVKIEKSCAEICRVEEGIVRRNQL